MVKQQEVLKLEHFVGSLDDDRSLDFQTTIPEPDAHNILIKNNSKIAVDSKGNVYVTGPRLIDNDGFAKGSFSKISPQGIVNIMQLDVNNDIAAIAIDKTDNIYLVEYASAYSEAGRGGSEYSMFPALEKLSRAGSFFKIYKYSPETKLSTFLGKTTSDMFFNVAIDSAGTLYTASYSSLKKITPGFLSNKNKKIISYDNDPFSRQDLKSSFYNEQSANSMVIDKADNLYFVERNQPMMIETDSSGSATLKTSGEKPYDVIKKITPAGVVSVVAGVSKGIGAVDGGGANAGFESLGSICIDSDGNLYALEKEKQTIRKIDNKGIVTTILGEGSGLVDAKSIAVHAKTLYILKTKGVDVIRNIP